MKVLSIQTCQFLHDQAEVLSKSRSVQSSPVQSSRPLGFGQVLSDQPTASHIEHCELACLNSTRNLG
ncbi:hypothetical protein Bca4012_097586 [Brassica carinata]